jgi:hypothetical protein
MCYLYHNTKTICLPLINVHCVHISCFAARKDIQTAIPRTKHDKFCSIYTWLVQLDCRHLYIINVSGNKTGSDWSNLLQCVRNILYKVPTGNLSWNASIYIRPLMFNRSISGTCAVQFKFVPVNDLKAYRESRGIAKHILRVWPHRKRAAAAGSDLPPRREGLRTVLRKTVSAASARHLFEGEDEVVRNTGRKPSRRGHRSLPAAAVRFLCGQTLNLGARGAEWSTSSLNRSNQGKKSGTHWIRGWVAHTGGLDDLQKILPMPQFEPGTVQSGTYSLYRLT